MNDRIPARRMGAAEERASAAIFLASSESSFVNGAELRVDGGSTCLGAAVAETWSIGRHLPCRMGGDPPSLADGGSIGGNSCSWRSSHRSGWRVPRKEEQADTGRHLT
ncbi:SDR family oxidoreductase [Stenotrophomonas rhizophila]|uniref:SDR family oxidoreductase n=1 Tax=Stenotrophomonas rhizophila TaxID=216778 RepID=UPI0009F38F19